MNATTERLMDLAEARIRDGGYGGFSFRDLAREAGITSASVHHHFSTKPKMAAAVARRYGDRFLADMATRPDAKGYDAISLYMQAFRQSLVADGRMCLCGVLGAEAGILAPEIADEIQRFFRQCVDDLGGRIGGRDAETRAFGVMATLEGGMMLARAYKTVDAFDKATANLGHGRQSRPAPSLSPVS